MSRRALLLGATGLVGGHCLRLLLDCDAYQEVRVLTRRPLGIDHPKLIEKVVEPAQFDKETEYFQVDDVFCALGTTLKQAGSKEAFRAVDLDLITAVGRAARDAGSGARARAHTSGERSAVRVDARREAREVEDARAGRRGRRRGDEARGDGRRGRDDGTQVRRVHARGG